MLGRCNLLESELTVPGLITESSRFGPKFKPMIGLSCLMRLMMSRRKSPPNLKTALWAYVRQKAKKQDSCVRSGR